MKAFLSAVALAALMTAPALAQDEPLKVGFVYVGPVGDNGWTFQHNEGRLAVEEEFGDRVETSFVENVAESSDSERVIRQMAESGHDLIFTTSFGFMNPTVKVAAQFPDVKFEHATGYKRADNVSTYAARFYEGRYIIGQIAGEISESGTVGYIASYPIPEVIRGINSFMLGAQSVNPDIEVKIIWVNSWFDPGKESDAASALIDQGADVITQHTDSPAPMQVAERRGVKAFGQASDMAEFGPTAQVTSIIDDWSPYYIARVNAALDGTWTSTDTWGGLADGEVVMAEYANIPADVAERAAATEEAIRSGELHPFAGPITNQAGEEVVAEGEVLSDGDLLGMNYYVAGIDDSVPN